MSVERRGRVTHGGWANGKPEEPNCTGRRKPSEIGTSRISREAYVRFCERLGVRFPGPTRQGRGGALLGKEACVQDAAVGIVQRHHQVLPRQARDPFMGRAIQMHQHADHWPPLAPAPILAPRGLSVSEILCSKPYNDAPGEGREGKRYGSE